MLKVVRVGYWVLNWINYICKQKTFALMEDIKALKLFFLYLNMYILRGILNVKITLARNNLGKTNSPSDCSRWLGIHVTPSGACDSSYRSVIGSLERNVLEMKH